MKYMVIDPPSGWKYGFPKRVEMEKFQDESFNLREWLAQNGYPLYEMEGDKLHYRFWTEDGE